MPGISGATSTPEGIPASLNAATASSRLRGCGVCGSVSRQIFSSSVGTEKLTLDVGDLGELQVELEVAQ